MGTPTRRATVLGCIFLGWAAWQACGRGLGALAASRCAGLVVQGVACLRLGCCPAVGRRRGGGWPHGQWEASRMRGAGRGHRRALQHCLNHEHGGPCSSSARGRGSRHSPPGRPQPAGCAGCRCPQVRWQWVAVQSARGQPGWRALAVPPTAGCPPQRPAAPPPAPTGTRPTCGRPSRSAAWTSPAGSRPRA